MKNISSKKILLVLALLIIFISTQTFFSDSSLYQPIHAQSISKYNPAEIYTIYLKAQKEHNIKVFQMLLSNNLKKEIEQYGESDLSIVLSFAPQNVKITGMQINGDFATLEATGFLPMGQVNGNGIIKLVKENNSWRVNSESWKSSNRMDNSSSFTYSVGDK